MITIGDLDRLMNQWKLRLAQPDKDAYDTIYKDGVSDCLYDLNNLIDELIDEEARVYTYMTEIGGN